MKLLTRFILFIASVMNFWLTTQAQAFTIYLSDLLTVERITVRSSTSLRQETGMLLRNGQFQVSVSCDDCWPSTLPVPDYYRAVDGHVICQLAQYEAYSTVPGVVKNVVRSTQVYRLDALDYVIVCVTGVCNPNAQPPSITTQPSSRTVSAGANVTFNVVATGNPAPAYQWRKDGANLTGKTSASLTLNNVQLSDAGNYTVVVANSGGSVTSVVASLTVITPPTSPFTLIVDGDGLVSPNLNGQSLELGKSYTIKATPGAGHIFVGWSGGVTSSVPTLTFLMQSNLVLQASFVPNPFVPSAGIYNGLFYEINNQRHLSSGSFTASTTTKGTYSAKILSGIQRISLSGQFDTLGRATNVVMRPGLSPITVELELDLSGGDQIRGRVTDGSWSATLFAEHAVFNSKTRVAPQAGRYTMLVQGDVASLVLPGGDGFGALTVDAGGRVGLKGALADNSKVSVKALLSKHGTAPLYVSLYHGAGSALGWITVTNGSASDVSGELFWFKPADPLAKLYPAGFAIAAPVVGLKYTPPVAPTAAVNFSSGVVTLTGAGLPMGVTNNIIVGPSSKVTNLSSNKLTLTITASSGLFKGSVVNPSTTLPITFNGAVLQGMNGGYGFFINTNQSGKVHLGPP